ncbi:unnamed protein product [Albugo candida]|uniref:Uncharacterized protein n=1 Tax=Albugo candida TaxID=65357 RepID=A0A024FVP4_9STRA|nr:unnamed protein product [Albugo candida]|eukprot:CCI11238.1 unnamed protein product [Albugo candida]
MAKPSWMGMNKLGGTGRIRENHLDIKAIELKLFTDMKSRTLLVGREKGQLAPRSNYIEKNVHFSFASPLLAKVVTSETLVPNRQAFPPQRNVSNCLNSQFAWNRLLGKPRLKQYLPSRPHYHFSRS